MKSATEVAERVDFTPTGTLMGSVLCKSCRSFNQIARCAPNGIKDIAIMAGIAAVNAVGAANLPYFVLLYASAAIRIESA